MKQLFSVAGLEAFKAQVQSQYFVRILHVFVVMHVGWESDNWAAVVEHKGNRGDIFAVTTDHGRIRQLSASELKSYRTRLAEASTQANQAWSLLTHGKEDNA